DGAGARVAPPVGAAPGGASRRPFHDPKGAFGPYRVDGTWFGSPGAIFFDFGFPPQRIVLLFRVSSEIFND
ncbi:MAG: hypothetical protein JSW50_01005, partial [Candidatus Latescibacterota bacterium]